MRNVNDDQSIFYLFLPFGKNGGHLPLEVLPLVTLSR
jgi:hypothetical protein